MVRRKAFTLIELLVVIAIIMMVLAIFAPALRKARKQARAAGCQVNLRQWATALATIVEDNEGRFPRNDSMEPEAKTPLWILTGRCNMEKTNGLWQAPRQYHPIGTKGMLCPEASRPADDSTPTADGGGGGWGFDGTSWEYDIKGGGTNRAWVFTQHAGPATDEFRVSCSYGFNGWLFQPPGGPLTAMEKFEALRSSQGPSYTNFFMLRDTARVPVLLDCTYYSSSPTPGHSASAVVVGGPMERFYMDRHSQHINCLFFDWSVRKVGLKELSTLKWYVGLQRRRRAWTHVADVTLNKWLRTRPVWKREYKRWTTKSEVVDRSR